MIKQKIREVAEAKDINQMELARMSGVGYTTIRRIFDEPTYTPNFPTLERIAKALDVSTLELVEEVSDEEDE